jgi:hypothetical protein
MEQVQLLVVVRSFDYSHIAELEVVLEQDVQGTYEEITTGALKRPGTTQFEGLESGSYRLTVGGSDHESQVRDFVVSKKKKQTQHFTLGQPGMSYYYASGVKSPCSADPNLIIIEVNRTVDQSELDTYASQNGLTEQAYSGSKANGVRAFLWDGTVQSTLSAVVNGAEALAAVRGTGMPVVFDEHQLRFLKNEALVVLESGVNISALLAEISASNFTVVGPAANLRNTHRLKYSDIACSTMLTDIETLKASSGVISVEPDVRQPIESFAPPTDFLYPMQWHLGLMLVPNAWERLNSYNPAIKYGDSSIEVAVYDGGIETYFDGTNFVARHPEFKGGKVADFYDFDFLLPGNEGVGTGHGQMVSGILAAPASADNEGVVGVAPGIKIGSYKQPSIAPFSATLGFFNWLSGLDHGFGVEPALHEPADLGTARDPGPWIVNNSWGGQPGTSIPLDSLEELGFDNAAVYGRYGRGLLVFFAAGNARLAVGGANAVVRNIGNDINDEEPYAAHEKTIAVSASTLDDDGLTEIFAPWSYNGDGIDFCAPSHDLYGSNLTIDGKKHSPPTRYGVITSHLYNGSTLLDFGDQNFLEDSPNLPGSVGNLETQLIQDAAGSQKFIQVANSSGLAMDQKVVIGEFGVTPYEVNTIDNKSNPDDIAQVFITCNLLKLDDNLNMLYTAGTKIRGLGHEGEVAINGADTLGPNQIRLLSTAGFVENQKIIIGDLNDSNSEVRTISAPVTSPIITLNVDLTQTYSSGDPVHVYAGAEETVLTATATVGTPTLTLQSSSGFQVGHAVIIDAADSLTAEGGIIIAVDPAGTTITLQENLFYTHTGAVTVRGGHASYTNRMGGTSSSTPMSAGLAALILSVNSELSWVEVRDIMRTTAMPIDVAKSGVNGDWKNKDGLNIHDGSDDLVIPSSPATASLSSATTVGETILPVSPNVFADGQAIKIGGTNPEITMVRSTSAGTQTVPLTKAHAAGDSVTGGLIPHYSPYFGHGRLDFLAAVTRTEGTVPVGGESERDLMLRNFLYEEEIDATTTNPFQDLGKAATVTADIPIQSPDIWVSNEVLAPTAINLLNFQEEGPNQLIDSGVDEPVFTGLVADQNDLRVSGIYSGTGPADFIVKITDDSPSKFQWNKDGGSFSGNTTITAETEYPLSDGLFVSFGNSSGHTLANEWAMHVEEINDREIYTRVYNRGNGGLSGTLSSLDAWVRTSIALSDGTVAATPPNFTAGTPFLFPNQWVPDFNNLIGDLAASSAENTYMIGEIDGNGYLINHEIHLAEGDVAAGATKVVAATWSKYDLPDVNTTLKPYLLVQVAPTDGPFAGYGAESNNNISYREISFADVFISEADSNNALPNDIEVDNFGTSITTDFQVSYKANIGWIKTESLELEFVREKSGNVTEKATFSYNGTVWVLKDQAGNVPTWVSVMDPVLTRSATAAAGDNKHVQFIGDFEVSKAHDKITVKATEHSSTTVSTTATRSKVPVVSLVQEINVNEMQLLPIGDASSLKKTIVAKSHAFAEMGSLSQTSLLAFGPVDDGTPGNMSEERGFRGTSLFTSGTPGTPIKAFAAVNGFVMIQEGKNPATQVNLILRPFTQAVVGFTPVKYFIYRGLLKSSFIKSGDDTKVVDELPATNSDWITYLYGEHNDQNPGDPFLSKAVGYDTANQPVGDLVDEYFFRSDPDNMLPFAERGIWLGDFDEAATPGFGFEIILEDGDIEATFAFTRKEQAIVDAGILIDTPPADPSALAFRRNQALSFVDAAAYYGLHMVNDGTVIVDNAGTKENKQGLTIFTDVMDKFFTKNKVYIDIRNENGYQLNFYGNYDDGNGNQIEFGLTKATTTPQKYLTSDWPIIILDASATVQNSADGFNRLWLEFYVDADTNANNNNTPLLYVEQGLVNNVDLDIEINDPDISANLKDNFLHGVVLYDGTSNKTLPMPFQLPNTGAATMAQSAAWHMKLHFTRRIDATIVWPPKVVQTTNYLDNLFGPVGGVPPWDSSSYIQWSNIVESKFMDGELEIGTSNVVERGVAFEGDNSTGRAIFYTNTLAKLTSNSQDFGALNGTTGGTSDDESFFHVRQMFSNFDLNFDVIIDSSNEVVTLNFVEDLSKDFSFVRRENIQVLGLHRMELSTLDSIAGFSDNHEKTMVLDNLGLLTDVNGQNYFKYRVGVQGLEAGTGNFKKVIPTGGGEVIAFSKDGTFICTSLFSAAEPAPTQYDRNVEEGLGAIPKHPKETHTIEKIEPAGSDMAITLAGGTAFTHLTPNTPMEFITINGSSDSFNNDSWQIKAVSTSSGGKTVITVADPLIATASPNGELSYEELGWEDHFIALDQEVISGAPAIMGTLVSDFIAAVTAVPNDNTAPAALNTIASNGGSEILLRARKAVDYNMLANPDDRPLYWARLKMAVALKSHPWLVKSAIHSDAAADIFERASRGYDGISFPAGTAKKILVLGFDPFSINPKDTENVFRSNPSGVCSLYLNGKNTSTIASAPNTVEVQSIVIPTRFEDFDNGIIDEIVEPFIRNNTVDMIITMSQGDPNQYDIDRFATRYRGGEEDNAERRNVVARYYLPKTGGGIELAPDPNTLPDFLETDLPFTAMIDNRGANTKVIFNEGFKLANTYERPEPTGTNTSNIKSFADPKALGGDSDLVYGSGANFLSNESFYRVALMRTKLTTTVLSGHLHLPKLQTVLDPFSPTDTKELVDDVVEILKNAVNAI